ncbi:MAG: hypothetical protein JJ920_04845 [Roseitalea sp.]|nr:hypothetical protein [Roseitalea sp.]MBO6721298.1 hypothetical protein [Roseitalea sp.]MBO6742217.1 hypothetical protein [Roseitalea sp.]
MNLSAPTQLVFIISAVIALVALLMAINVIAFIPVASVWIALVAFVVLAAGTLLKGV